MAEAPSGWTQTGYEILLRSHDGTIYRSEVDSSEQILVAWPFNPLSARERGSVSVRVRDGQTWSEFSEPTMFEVGLIDPADWTAQLITTAPGSRIVGAPRFVTEFELESAPQIARLYITSRGIQHVQINGESVGDEVLSPGWTEYDSRLNVTTVDVTSLLRAGRNSIEALIGRGWYKGRLGWLGESSFYDGPLGLLLQLELSSGSDRRVVASDSSWMVTESDVLSDDLYDGEHQILHRRSDLPPERVAVNSEFDFSILENPVGPPIRVRERLSCLSVSPAPEKGEFILDFGENVVGWVELDVLAADTGRTIRVRHAEVLENGALAVKPLRTAKATDVYEIGAGFEGTVRPHFTFHGFRFASVSGATAAELHAATACVIGSDMTRTGRLETSHEMLNTFHENALRSLRGNFVGVPMDCPQRDERMGWTGDVQLFGPSATRLLDVAGFLDSWLRDLAIAQLPDGSVPYVVPNVLRVESPAAAGWGDAAVVLPWLLYERYGDIAALRRCFQSMTSWVDRVDRASGPEHIWKSDFQFGDWLDPNAPIDRSDGAVADQVVVATAYFFRSASITARAAQVLGEHEAAEQYAQLALATKIAFNDHFVTATGLIQSDCQTVYSMAIAWGLVDQGRARHGAEARLEYLLYTSGFTISTGILGTPLVLEALTIMGRSDLAVRMLLATRCPSWLYPVTMGATTIWERWDSLLPTGEIHPGSMTSFNHYALGAIVDWLYGTLAGITPVEPAYRHTEIAPVLDDRVPEGQASVHTPYGRIEVKWQPVAPGLAQVEAQIPVGVTARLGNREGAATSVGHGTHTWTARYADIEMPPLSLIKGQIYDESAFSRLAEVAIRSGLSMKPADVALQLAPHLGASAKTIPEHLQPAFVSGEWAEFRAQILDTIKETAYERDSDR